jgi:hypothetical protein
MTAAGMAVAAAITAVLPPRATTVAMGSDSNGGGTDKNQQSTKFSDGIRIRDNDSNGNEDGIEGNSDSGSGSGNRSAAAAQGGRWPAWRRWWQHGKSAALAGAASLAAEAAAWQDCGDGGGQLGGRGGSLARARRWQRCQRSSGIASGSMAVAARQQRSQQQRSCGRVTAAAASLAADAAAWQKRDFGDSGSTLGVGKRGSQARLLITAGIL